MKRLISMEGKEFLNLGKLDLKNAIAASEGRTILAENVPSFEPYLSGITNAEIEKSYGADLILFNVLDLFNPLIKGIPDNIDQSDSINWIKEAICRPIGVNLEPVDDQTEMTMDKVYLDEGRKASRDTFKRANELGIDFICLTGNPATGVTNKEIKSSIIEAKKIYNGLIISGKMHSAGTSERVMDLEIAKMFIEAGTDVLLIPAPYTVPHFTEENFLEISDYIMEYNKDKSIEDRVLIMSSIGTSQETSDTSTIRKIALSAKSCGADIQHIGDAQNGISTPINIYTMGVAIRGTRHQISMISKSIIRGE